MEEQGRTDSGTNIKGMNEQDKRRGRRGGNTENSEYYRTPLFAGDTFLENATNVESANVGALFQWDRGGVVPGDSRFIRENEKSHE